MNEIFSNNMKYLYYIYIFNNNFRLKEDVGKLDRKNTKIEY